MPEPLPSPLAEPSTHPVDALEFAAHLAARMCHDFISPAGAIVSGLDLLEDPGAQDMREEALNLIAASARKLVAQLAFDRVAFGASAAAETFDVRALEQLTRDMFAHVRGELDWSVEPQGLAKPAARVLLNLAQIGAVALPTGGVAKVSAAPAGDWMIVQMHAVGQRARLRPEVMDGLNGQALGEGLAGHWVQAFYLRGLVDAAGGSLQVATTEGDVLVRARLPL